jgi:hypothetical protein
MWQPQWPEVLAHAGHPELVTHEGGHVALALIVVVVVAVATVGLYALLRRVSLKSSASWNSSGTDARSGVKRVTVRSYRTP